MKQRTLVITQNWRRHPTNPNELYSPGEYLVPSRRMTEDMAKEAVKAGAGFFADKSEDAKQAAKRKTDAPENKAKDAAPENKSKGMA